MDQADFTILHSLQDNARIAMAELARKTGLSAKAIAERMKRLEEDGVIIGYHAVLNPAKIGYPVRAYVCITAKREMFTKIINYARDTVEVREAHHGSEPHSFVLRVVARDEAALEVLLKQLAAFGEVECARIIATPVEKHTT